MNNTESRRTIFMPNSCTELPKPAFFINPKHMMIDD